MKNAYGQYERGIKAWERRDKPISTIWQWWWWCLEYPLCSSVCEGVMKWKYH